VNIKYEIYAFFGSEIYAHVYSKALRWFEALFPQQQAKRR
jgi:hypothetical protein